MWQIAFLSFLYSLIAFPSLVVFCNAHTYRKKRKILLCVSSSLFSCFSKRVNVVYSYEFSFEIFRAQDAGVMNAAEIISFFILPPDFFDCEWWSWTVIGGRGRRHVTLILL